jgi:PKD repeat protein
MNSGKKQAIFLIIIAITSCFGLYNVAWTNSDEGLIKLSPYPVVYVYPNFTEVEPGETFTIAVIGFNFTDKLISDPTNPAHNLPLGNLYGFDIEFTWNPAVLECIDLNVTIPVDVYKNPIPPSPYNGSLYQPILNITHIVEPEGNIPGASSPETRAWFVYASMSPASPRNGNLTFFTMTFKVLKSGESSLRIIKCDLAALGVAAPIYKIVLDGFYRTTSVPVPSFDYAPSIPVINRKVEFVATVARNTSSIATYVWDFGDGYQQNTTEPVVTHNYTSTGEMMPKLKVIDTFGVESGWVQKTLTVIAFRDLAVSAVRLPAPKIKRDPDNLLSFDVTIVNFGAVTENCTVSAYYNATIVDTANPETAIWNLVESKDTSIEKAIASIPSSRSLTFTMNTTLLVANTRYYMFVNLTGIPNEYERNTTDNQRLSDSWILVTDADVHEVRIDSFECVWRGGGTIVRSPPLIEGESATIQLQVKNMGTSLDTANITLYVDNTAVEDFSLQLLWGEEIEVPSWEESIAFGYHNLTVVLAAGDFSIQDTLWLRVVKPPQLVVDIAPSEPLVNQTITLDSSASLYEDPEGNITQWMWKLYAPGVSAEGIPTATLDGETVTYSFSKSGNWTVVLDVTDSYLLKLDSKRSATNAYHEVVTVSVTESVQQPGGFPIEYVLIVVLIMVVVVVAAVFVLYRKRTRAPKSAESKA